jgi:hypothetical protein
VIVLGFLALGALAIGGMTAFVWHKARVAGVDGDLLRTDPGLAVAKIMAATNPNLEFVRTNRDDGTITLRDRHTGKQFSISIDAARNGRFTLKADDDHGSGSVEIGGDGKIPSWIPQYPGSHPQTTVTAKGESDEGAGEAGNFNFETDDSQSRVMRFYEDKAREMGMTLTTGEVFDAGTIVATDPDRQRHFKVVAISGSRTTVNVTYGRKR